MTDEAILEQFRLRSEDAVKAAAEKYGAFLNKIARNILHQREDAEECVNDTYLTAWEQIPPDSPRSLAAYLGRIVRCKALNRFDYLSAQRRNTDFTLQLSELEECLPGGAALEERFEAWELGAAISAFLRGEKAESRTLFIRRYWYSDSVRALSRRYHISESKVKSSLFRTRNRLRAYLEQEGYAV